MDTILEYLLLYELPMIGNGAPLGVFNSVGGVASENYVSPRNWFNMWIV